MIILQAITSIIGLTAKRKEAVKINLLISFLALIYFSASNPLFSSKKGCLLLTNFLFCILSATLKGLDFKRVLQVELLLSIICSFTPLHYKAYPSIWFKIHPTLVFSSYSLLLLVLTYRLSGTVEPNPVSSTALTMFSLALVTGGFWAKSVYGKYWTWSTIEVCALSTWIFTLNLNFQKTVKAALLPLLQAFSTSSILLNNLFLSVFSVALLLLFSLKNLAESEFILSKLSISTAFILSWSAFLSSMLEAFGLTINPLFYWIIKPLVLAVALCFLKASESLLARAACLIPLPFILFS